MFSQASNVVQKTNVCGKDYVSSQPVIDFQVAANTQTHIYTYKYTQTHTHMHIWTFKTYRLIQSNMIKAKLEKRI